MLPSLYVHVWGHCTIAGSLVFRNDWKDLTLVALLRKSSLFKVRRIVFPYIDAIKIGDSLPLCVLRCYDQNVGRFRYTHQLRNLSHECPKYTKLFEEQEYSCLSKYSG